jgi:hypothetical protein
MALILAVNPGSTQSATLARVARQLQGHELIGADSCAVAMKAIEQRMPALVLLPPTATKGEAELLQRLRMAPRGGVPSLRLPSPTAVDPRALADEIRELLGEASASPAAHSVAPQRAPTTSIHLIMAATAAIDWIRARRASWPPMPATVPASPAPVPRHEPAPMPELEPVYEYASRTQTPKTSKPKTIEWEPPPADTWAPPPPSWESDRPSGASRGSAAGAETRQAIVAWLPRVAALAVVGGLIWVGIGYWPQVVAGVSSAIGSKAPSAGTDAARPETAPPAAATPARGGRAAAPPAVSLPGGSGFLAVFSSVEITVSEGATSIPLDDRSQAILSAGRHRLRFQNRALGYDEVRTVQIRPTETTTLNLTPQTTIGVTSNEPAEVSIDGAVVGGTPLKGHRIPLGTHTVIVRAAGGERQISVEATSKPVQLAVDFTKPQ